VWGRPVGHAAEGKGFFLFFHLLNVGWKTTISTSPRGSFPDLSIVEQQFPLMTYDSYTTYVGGVS
jgi:hypothetical protein